MSNTLLKNEKYSERYIQKSIKLELPLLLKKILKDSKINSICDLGCGDGNLISSFLHFYPSLNITGIDISKRRISHLKDKFPLKSFLQGDILKISLKNNFDLVCNTQVIEHIDRPLDLIKRFKILTKKGGFVFVTSVVKKPWAIYKYRNNRKFVLDPTHVSEFNSVKEFYSLFERDFKFVDRRCFPVARKIFGISVRIPGFYIVEALLQKK